MPDVDGPQGAVPLDFRVSGREMRVVEDRYHATADCVGPPEIFTWCRFCDTPSEARLHAALAVRSITH
jgi:hypothetical protein